MLILAINVYNLTKGNLNDIIDNKQHNIENTNEKGDI